MCECDDRHLLLRKEGVTAVSLTRTLKSKRLITFMTGIGLALSILAATASAAITITQAPPGPGYQNLSPWNCGGHFYKASGAPIRLGFGWFANNEGGLKQFFQNTHGDVSIQNTADPTDTFSDSWVSDNTGAPFVSTQGIAWTDGEAGTGSPPGGGTVTGVATIYRGVLTLAPGTYTLHAEFVIDKTISDGWDSYSGTIDNGSGCTFTVGP
jgi:hypothetical protein